MAPSHLLQILFGSPITTTERRTSLSGAVRYTSLLSSQLLLWNYYEIRLFIFNLTYFLVHVIYFCLSSFIYICVQRRLLLKVPFVPFLTFLSVFLLFTLLKTFVSLIVCVVCFIKSGSPSSRGYYYFILSE